MCSHLAIRVSSIHVLAFCRYPPSRHLETSRLELSRILGSSISHDLHGSQHLPSCVSIRHYLKYHTTLHAILPSMPLWHSAPYYRLLRVPQSLDPESLGIPGVQTPDSRVPDPLSSPPELVLMDVYRIPWCRSLNVLGCSQMVYFEGPFQGPGSLRS